MKIEKDDTANRIMFTQFNDPTGPNQFIMKLFVGLRLCIIELVIRR